MVGPSARAKPKFWGALFVALGVPAALACGSKPTFLSDEGIEPTREPRADEPDGSADAAEDVETNADAESDANGPSRCVVTDSSIACEHEVTKLVAGTITRDVYWQKPSTAPPAGGYPVVVVYQGGYEPPSRTWGKLTPSASFGSFQQGRLQAMLLDHGFTVIAPEATGGVAWQTNSPLPYDSTADKQVIDALLASIAAGKFGPANMARLYATGMSSGGYMTSRMAVSHRGKFRALAIQSASYATCLAAACVVPSTLPADHPPTLFLHGERDTTVPLYTAESYYDELVDEGVETQKIVDPTAGHEWLSVAPERITEWFSAH